MAPRWQPGSAAGVAAGGRANSALLPPLTGSHVGLQDAVAELSLEAEELEVGPVHLDHVEADALEVPGDEVRHDRGLLLPHAAATGTEELQDLSAGGEALGVALLYLAVLQTTGWVSIKGAGARVRIARRTPGDAAPLWLSLARCEAAAGAGSGAPPDTDCAWMLTSQHL